MARIQISFAGQSPLLCHNPQLADPDNEIVREIAAITGKRTKTPEDRKAISRLEWFGGLYLASGYEGPVLPTANLRKCLVDAGKVSRQGTQLQRALFLTSLYVPIQYEGPRNVEQLYAREAFQCYLSVGIGQSRTMRMRPQFPDWGVTVEAELLDDVMDIGVFGRILERAGLMVGLGDNRINGYGRFAGTVST